MNKSIIYRSVRITGAGAALGYLLCLPGCGSADPGGTTADKASEEVATVGQEAKNPIQCGNDLTACIQAAKTIPDLFTCNQNYATCLAGAFVPPIVTTTVNGLDACRTTLGTCSAAAKTPAALATCQVTAVNCSATALATPIATTVASAVGCIDAAATCAGKATTPAQVNACGGIAPDRDHSRHGSDRLRHHAAHLCARRDDAGCGHRVQRRQRAVRWRGARGIDPEPGRGSHVRPERHDLRSGRTEPS
jgi:hypothetical protein